MCSKVRVEERALASLLIILDNALWRKKKRVNVLFFLCLCAKGVPVKGFCACVCSSSRDEETLGSVYVTAKTCVRAAQRFRFRRRWKKDSKEKERHNNNNNRNVACAHKTNRSTRARNVTADIVLRNVTACTATGGAWKRFTRRV